MDLDTIYRLYFRDVELYLLAKCRDKHLAEELTEQVFFHALEALPKFRGDSDIRTWLCAIARNKYISHMRQQKKELNFYELELTDPESNIEEQIIDRQQAMRIHRHLHELPDPYKEVFSLRVFGQLSFEDIGSLFQRSANWACVTYHRARRKIQENMEESI